MTFSSDQQVFILITAFLSVFGVIGIYNLSLYFVIRRRVLLDYCIFVLTLMFYASVYLMDLLQLNVDVDSFSTISATSAACGGLLFSRSFFQINSNTYPKLDLAFRGLISIGLIIILAQTIKSLIDPSLSAFNFVTSISAAILALLTLILFICSSIILWNKELSARIFVFTLIPLILGSGIYVIYWLTFAAGGTDFNSNLSLTMNTILFSSVTLQMVLYSVIIGYGLKNLEREKLDLQKDINKRLNEEVRKQTSSLVDANKEIEHQKQQLEASNQMKNKLFSLVSHDMRGPLNGLAGLVDVLDQDKIPREQLATFTSQLKNKIKDSVLVLNRLLQWSHAQLDEVKIRKEIFSLEELVEENITLFQEQLLNKQIQVNQDLQGPDVYADREMIDTIIRNLISNGIKFTGEQKTLHISSEANGEKTELKIRDEGVGMNPDWFNYLEENEELHSEPGTDGEQGVGFGLLICRDFIKMNGGSLVCQSEIGNGTTFTMTLESA